MKNLAQLSKGVRLFQAIQILPLQVLDNGHLRRLLVGDLAHDRRNRLFARELGRAAAPLAEDQNITSILARTHHDRLHYPIGADGFRQLLQHLRVKPIARLIRILLDIVEPNRQHQVSRRRPCRLRLNLRQNNAGCPRRD